MRRLYHSLTTSPFITRRPMIVQFVKFGLVGFLNTSIDYGLFAALVYLVHLHYLIANAISFSVAVINSFILNRRWTFQSHHRQWQHEAIKFMIVMLIGLGLNELILYTLISRLAIHTLIAKAIGIVIVLFWNFIGTRFWAFRHPPIGLPG